MRNILLTLCVVAVAAFMLLHTPNLAHALLQGAVMLCIIGFGYYFLVRAFKSLHPPKKGHGHGQDGQAHRRTRPRRRAF